MSSSWFIKALVASQIAKSFSNEKYNLFNSDVTVNGSAITKCVVSEIGPDGIIPTISGFVNGYFTIPSSLSDSFTITCPTAAVIVNYLTKCQLGSSFNFSVNTYQSGTPQTTNLETTTGITLEAGAGASINVSKVATFKCVVKEIGTVDTYGVRSGDEVSIYLVSLN